MGLDMYLFRVKNDSKKKKEDVMYWRKANHIHRWFVYNCQNGVDDCGEYEVSVEKLMELCKLCKLTLARGKKNPTELMPIQRGSFFGSTEVDEYYFQDLKDTMSKLLSTLITVKENEKFYYHASW